MNAKHTQGMVSQWNHDTLIAGRDARILQQSAENTALRAENERLRDALQAIERQAGHVAEALRIDGRMVGAYTKADASAHCGQIEAQARAALAGGK